MKYNNKGLGIFLLSFLLIMVGCNSLFDMDLQDNPNNVTEADADVNFLLNGIQISFIDIMAGKPADNEMGFNSSAMEVSRMINQFGTYTGPFSRMQSSDGNRLWEWSYMGVLKNSELLIKLAEEGGFNYHSGIGKVLKAFTLVNLVDFYGNVPYSEALLGAGNFNPGTTSGEEIYDLAYGLIDDAISDFGSGVPGGMPTDYFYNNDASKWIKMANTLKLKMHLQTRLVNASESKSAINSIISSGNYISNPDDDFFFRFSTVSANPDSRHPDFINNYLAQGGDDYMSNYYMNLLINDKSIRDPRLRYYIYRQTDEEPSGDDLPCSGKDYDYCYLGDAYWGRDHADEDGVPNDGVKRSLMGVYPAGGAFDGDTYLAGSINPGAAGAGLFPVFMSSFVKFMLAESVLTLETDGDARQLLEQGVRESIQRVMDFGAEQAAGSPFIPSADDIEIYVGDVLEKYDAAADNNEKLDVIITEYYLALFGNAIEAYSTIRRTGLPSTLQNPVLAAGPFPRSYLYPSNLTERNSSVSQKQVTVPVFWDNESAELQ